VHATCSQDTAENSAQILKNKPALCAQTPNTLAQQLLGAEAAAGSRNGWLRGTDLAPRKQTHHQVCASPSFSSDTG